MGASAILWYFEVLTDTKGNGTILKGTAWFYRYHMGSVAFGSFLIAICQAINHIFDYFRKKLGVLEKTVTWVRILLSMTSCCLFVMEHCIKFMSKNAYV